MGRSAKHRSVTVYLLDSTVFIHQWKRNRAVMSWIEAALERRDTTVTSSMNVAEVYAGANPEDRPAWDAMFTRIPVIPISAEHGAWAGRTQYDLARRGVTVQLGDLLIAAVASDRGLVVATENARHFGAIGVPFELVKPSS